MSRLLMAGLALAGALACGASATPGLLIKTRSGKIEGKRLGNVRAFLGVPYAAPPTGERRWRAPQDPLKWKGVRLATDFGPRCMQGPIYDDMVFRDPGPSEDCLTLNVWSGAVSDLDRQPVMVWIHGGGFTAGGSSEPRQDGARLASQGVVAVSLNYRLTIFGFLAMDELAKDSARGTAGDYGLMDQVAALKWIKGNIRRFGGDPNNVTIFGESAGAHSVSSLMASPLAKSLFQKAIGESGGAFRSETPAYETLQAREVSDSQWVRAEFGPLSLAELRKLPAKQLLDAAVLSEKAGGLVFEPNIDGYFLPQDADSIFAAGRQSDVPILCGWNRDEGSFGVGAGAAPPTLDSLRTTARKVFGDRTDEFLQVYGVKSDAEAPRAAEDFLGDQFIAWSAWNWIEAQASTGKSPIYRYRFDEAPPPDAGKPASLGAFHSAEILYVFGNLDARPQGQWREEDRLLSSTIQAYWTNFARTGNPNGSRLPPWPKYSSRDGWKVMYLNEAPQASADKLRSRYLFLKSTEKQGVPPASEGSR